uniref:Transcriptional regulator, Fis family n=1 Tax=mine drainage metagenome TaxID=410659 RepID=E6PPW6_9ZZZZ
MDASGVTSQGQNLGEPCRLRAPDHPVRLFEAIRDALCTDPKTRQAWAAVQVQAAQLGQARAAYWPKLDAALQFNRDHAASTVTGQPQFDSNVGSQFRTQALSLSWVLYDFGARTAAAHSAEQLLLASRYSLDDTLQTALLKTAKNYEAALAASAGLDAARDNARTAQESLDIAQARVQHGVAAISDALQAQTAYAQAAADETHAKGTWQTAIGALAIDMGLDPEAAPLQLQPLPADAGKSSVAIGSLHAFLDDAKRINPKINAARAQHLAALAHAKAVRDAGLPSLHFTWKYSRNTQPVTGLGLPSFPADAQDNFVGIELDIPLFDGFDQDWKMREAQAQAREQGQALIDARRQVMHGVWSGFEGYKTATADLGSTRTVLAVAQQSLAAAQKRYQLGVTSILEVLHAQQAVTGNPSASFSRAA